MAEITYTINQSTPEGVQGTEVYRQADKDLLQPFTVNSSFDSNKHLVELHILTLSDELIESDYNYNKYSILQGGQVGTVGASTISIDPVQDAKDYDYNTGGVKLLYHFYNDIFTKNKSTTDFFIQEISPDRTELRLNNLSIPATEVLDITTEIKNSLDSQSFFKELRLNFKNNDLFIVTNIDVTYQGANPLVTVKLYEPLPVQYSVKDTLSLVEFVNDSIVFEVDSVINLEQERPITLKSPNFNLEISDESTVPSQYLNYDELFSYQVSNTANEVYSLSSEKGAEISIDHTDYENFIHFSSAEERLLNFKYKVDLLHNYSASLVDLENTTTSEGTQGSVAQFENLIKGVVNNFDHYERFLYYESGSNSWPKSTDTKPYINKESTDTEAITWFANQRSLAIKYDKENPHQLLNTIPTYLRDDANNENYSIFIHMVAQHFDTLWVYSKSVTDKYNADNRLNFGVPKDLVEEALKNFGVKVYTSNKSIEDLFTSFIGQEYKAGQEVITNYITGSLIGTETSIPPSSYQNYQKEIYKRLYHNLPYLLKTKGTERGLRALVNCFGIPSDILTIKYFGGRNIQESTFLGDYRYYTSSLDKIRLDNTGSILEGEILSQNTSVNKRDNKYTDDLHRVEVGFSPTNEVDSYIESNLPPDFNIDNYLGNPGNLYEDSYQGLQTVVDNITAGLGRYNIKDYIRLIKFFDNIIFKMVKDFIPARAIADTGIIIKPHILDRNKAKSVQVSYTQPEYSGSIDTAFITGSNGGVFRTTNESGIDGEWNTSYRQVVQTPVGEGIKDYHNTQIASIDGEFLNSSIVVSNGELNQANTFKTPSFYVNNFNITRWLDTEGICILAPQGGYVDVNGGIYYDNGYFYLDSGSWLASDLFSGIPATGISYEVTSSNIPTASFNFPFETDNYANYTTHPITASNTSGDLTDCTSSFVMQVAICDIETTSEFQESIKPGDEYSIVDWFLTGSQNPSANINLLIDTVPTSTPYIYSGLLSDATASIFPGTPGDSYTLQVQDIQIPVTCTFNYNITAGLCAVTPVFKMFAEYTRWLLGIPLGTTSAPESFPHSTYTYGLARYFIGETPGTTPYRVRIYDGPTTYASVDVTVDGAGSGTFGDLYQGSPLMRYDWSYQEETINGIYGYYALFTISANPPIDNDEYLAKQFANYLRIDVTALESEPNCTPIFTIKEPAYDLGDF
jgi:hypothetical protein